MLDRSRRQFEPVPGSIPVKGDCGDLNGMGVPAAGEPFVLFFQLIWRLSLLVFLLASAMIDEENCFIFKWLCD
jgi:hypothetical protein